MSLNRLYPNNEVFEGLTAEDKSWVIARDYGICNGWRVNFAIDSQGNSFGETSTSSDVSSELDRLVLGKLRSLSDLIVTSGKTARMEKYKSSKHAPVAIFTTSGDLDSVPAIQGTQYFTPIVLTPQSNIAAVEASVSDVDVRVIPYRLSADEDWPIALQEVVHREGFQSPILESGLTTVRQFIASGVVDEICLTVTHQQSLKVSARDLSPVHLARVFGSFDGFELKSLFTDGNTTFSRWRRGSHAAK